MKLLAIADTLGHLHKDVTIPVDNATLFQLRKQNSEGRDKVGETSQDDNTGDKTGEENKMWNKVKMLLQNCTDVDALTQVEFLT